MRFATLLHGLVPILLTLPSCDRAATSGTPTAVAVAPPTLRHLAQLPVPPDARDLREETIRLQRENSPVALVDTSRRLVQSLQSAWGETDPRLAPYHYDLALALERAGRADDALTMATQGLRIWPYSAQHHVLDAKLRMDRSLALETVLPGTEESVARVTDPREAPALRGMHLRQSDLVTLWAHVLSRAGRPEAALDRLDAAGIPSDDDRARRIRARSYIALRRSEEAISILERAPTAARDVEHSLLLATALGDIERTDDAIRVASDALRASTAEVDKTARALLERTLSHNLVRAGRHAEARSLLRRLLITDPEDDELLFDLATTLRRLDVRATADALERRRVELVSHRFHISEAKRARTRGSLFANRYHHAMALRDLDRHADALSELPGRLTGAPFTVHAARVRIYLELGRVDRAWTAARASFEDLRHPAIAPLRSVLFSRAGRRDDARRAVEEHADAVTEDPGLRDLSRAWQILARLELGDIETLRAERDAERSRPSTQGDAELTDARVLRDAWLDIDAGRFEAARRALSQNVRDLPGADTMAAALLQIVDVLEPSTAKAATEFDASPLLDHPWLVELALRTERCLASPEARDVLTRARGLITRRGDLDARTSRLRDDDALPAWEELVGWCLENGLLRLARRSSWHAHRTLSRREVTGRLAVRSLSRPEDLFTRWSVLVSSFSQSELDGTFAPLIEASMRAIGETP